MQKVIIALMLGAATAFNRAPAASSSALLSSTPALLLATALSESQAAELAPSTAHELIMSSRKLL
jgi:hypothetical protein